ncbi:ISAs1 family transposase [Streptomyces noursei]|uniref:ISAs1 family transposase n=1 Tax=Streptomyces noursei TaxID=1971 RepID=UPI0013520ABC
MFDSRSRRGRRWPLLPVLRAAQAAVIAGATSFTAIADWLRHSTQDARARLDFPSNGSLGVRPVPAKDTVRRLLLMTCPQGLTALLTGRAMTEGRPERLAVDGKSVRSSRTRTAHSAHLLSGCDENGLVTGQMRIPDKTNEIPCLRQLYADVDLTDTWVTLDALHTQTETAKFLIEAKKAHFVMAMKANQPTLYAACRRLPWERAKARHTEQSRAHGQLERRTITVLTHDGLDFPHVAQVARIYRTRTEIATGKQTREIIHVITDLTSQQAKPHQLAAAVRGHWAIENKIHYVRDAVWSEDRSRIQPGHGPENMATLRNIAMNLLRKNGATNIAQAVREQSYHPFTTPLDLLGLPPRPAETHSN